MDPENCQFTRSDFELCTKNAFEKLLGEEDFSDVTLACNTNKQVKAHKVILGACMNLNMNLSMGLFLKT